MTATEEYLANNDRYAQTFSGPLPMPPARNVAVVACMDARLNVYGILGLGEGEAHVIRNAGGVVTEDQIRSLAISQRLLGTREIILIHHTDCGMLTFTDDAFKAGIQEETGIKPEWAAESFFDLDTDVRQSIARIKASPFVPHTDAVRGFVFDVETGKLGRGYVTRPTASRAGSAPAGDQDSGRSPRPCCSARKRSNSAPSSSAVGMFSGSS